MRRREFMALAAGAALAQQPKRYRVIDVHVHVFNSKIQGTNGIPKYYPDSTVEYTIEMMDRGGIDKAFLISYNAEDVSSEMRGRGQNPVELTEVANKQYQFNSWKAHKDRFWWFPDHIYPLREGYLETLEQDLRKGASGIKMLPIFHGLLPDHKSWIPVYEMCRKHKKPIILDLSWWYFGRYPIFNESRDRQNMAAAFKTFADYAKLITPLFQQFKGVPWSLAHCGTAKVKEDYRYIFDTIASNPNVSCDVAAVMEFSPAFIQELVKAVGSKKVMYGTDTPYWFKGPDSYRTGSRRWSIISEECPALSDADKQAILAGNAERFARNEVPA